MTTCHWRLWVINWVARGYTYSRFLVWASLALARAMALLQRESGAWMARRGPAGLGTEAIVSRIRAQWHYRPATNRIF